MLSLGFSGCKELAELKCEGNTLDTCVLKKGNRNTYYDSHGNILHITETIFKDGEKFTMVYTPEMETFSLKKKIFEKDFQEMSGYSFGATYKFSD